MAISLSVNLDKIALLRNSRDAKNRPNLLFFAEQALLAGADGLTVHPRSDLRHILPQDVYDLSKLDGAELNIEGNPLVPANKHHPGLLEIVKLAKPVQCTLVPDDEQQITSNRGWLLAENISTLSPIIQQLKDWHIRVSLFMDATSGEFKLAQQMGVDCIELYTESLALAWGTKDESRVWREFERAAYEVRDCGLMLNAGHDLNLDNLRLVKKLPNLAEVSIGHALIAEALWLGLAETIKRYKSLLD
ncbi:MAG: pyridoxine 5'-phosphate synthase [SAR324 cluster bacterium]|nr:pyridoxine 5'-phosphate synthase [SAR324 cluster bacterium]